MLVLVPCEPGSVMGSRGDEAMIYAILGEFFARRPDGRVVVACGPFGFKDSPDAHRLAHDFPNVEFCDLWRGWGVVFKLAGLYRQTRAGETAVLGADCMDGHWGPDISMELFMAADIAARMGIETHLTGFSYNANAWPGMARLFKGASEKLRFNLRDEVSLSRFPVKRARLVADVAFLLAPAGKPEKPGGAFRLGVNLHTMLPGADAGEWLGRVASALQSFIDKRRDSGKPCKVVLIPHDYRAQGDLQVLRGLKSMLHGDVELVEEVLSAAEIKALAGTLDALFTSRMHLGIAALGMGVPVAAFGYQGKFEGLFRHFGLPRSLLLAPGEPEKLCETLDELVQNAPALANAIREKLPDVVDLAKLNFAVQAGRRMD